MYTLSQAKFRILSWMRHKNSQTLHNINRKIDRLAFSQADTSLSDDVYPQKNSELFKIFPVPTFGLNLFKTKLELIHLDIVWRTQVLRARRSIRRKESRPLKKFK